MPQMELVKFNGGNNLQVLNFIRGQLAGTDYDNRIPAATKANIQDVMQSLWDIPQNRNQFVDALFNKVGLTQLRYMSYTNPLAKYKRGMMSMGESIEEVALGLLTAKAYNPDADYLEDVLFAREPNEVQSRWHRIDRNDMYKLTINQSLLKRAFLNPNGLSEFVTGQMSTIATSDQFDEFEIMLNLLNRYYEEDGFFKVAVPDISKYSATQNDAKQYLKVVRGWINELPLKPSVKYNAAHMPIVPQASDLELFITPKGQANLDVEALAAAFNISQMDVTSRTTIIPEDDITIPGFQGVITTKEFWICADTYVDMVQQPNVAGRYTNFFHHHEGIVSASPFVPALLLTSAEEDTISVITYDITGLNPVVITDLTTDVVLGNTTLNRGNAYLVATTAVTNPTGAPENVTGVTLSISGRESTRTHISQLGVLVIGYDETATSLTLHVEATKDNSQNVDVTLTLAGDVVEGSIGQYVDSSTSVINNIDAPTISANANNTLLTADPGKWDTKSISYGYQWTANGTPISGATNKTYAPVSGNAGQLINVTVTPTKSGYTSVPASAEEGYQL